MNRFLKDIFYLTFGGFSHSSNRCIYILKEEVLVRLVGCKHCRMLRNVYKICLSELKCKDINKIMYISRGHGVCLLSDVVLLKSDQQQQQH